MHITMAISIIQRNYEISCNFCKSREKIHPATYAGINASAYGMVIKLVPGTCILVFQFTFRHIDAGRRFPTQCDRSICGNDV